MYYFSCLFTFLAEQLPLKDWIIWWKARNIWTQPEYSSESEKINKKLHFSWITNNKLLLVLNGSILILNTYKILRNWEVEKLENIFTLIFVTNFYYFFVFVLILSKFTDPLQYFSLLSELQPETELLAQELQEPASSFFYFVPTQNNFHHLEKLSQIS